MSDVQIKLIQYSESHSNGADNLTLSLSNVTAGNTLICTVVNREENIVFSDGWDSLGNSTGFTNGGVFQREYFFSKRAEYSEETITISQSGTGAIYVIATEFSNVSSVIYDSSLNNTGTSDYTVSATKSEGQCVLYGVHSIYYTTSGGRLQACTPSDLEKLEGNNSEERLVCWFDNGKGEQVHTFITAVSSGSASYGAEVAGVVLTPYMSKYLISDSGKYYNITDELLTELPVTELTADVFLEYGNDGIPPGSILASLSGPTVMSWTDGNSALSLTATVTAEPQSQTVISEPIDLTHSSILGIENVTADSEGGLICAVSTDGTTWQAWDGTQWIGLSDEFSGMSAEALGGITVDDWSEFLGGAETVYLRIALTDTTQTVTQIYVDFAN